jgi:hypothetical protein
MHDLVMRYINEGNHPAAVIELEKIVFDKAPNLMPLLAKTYILAGCHDKAIQLSFHLFNVLKNDTDNWLVMELGRMLIKSGHHDLVAQICDFFKNTNNINLEVTRRGLLVEMMMVTGRPADAINYLDTSTIWSHLFIYSSCHLLKQIIRQRGGEEKRTINPYSKGNLSTVGFSLDSLAYWGRFGHTVLEYLQMRELSEKYSVPLETPDWVGHYVFQLDDPKNIFYRQRVRCSADQIEKNIDKEGVSALLQKDFFGVGAPQKWSSELVRKAKELLKFRPEVEDYLKAYASRKILGNKTVVVIHLRLGDRKEELEKIQNVLCYKKWLTENFQNFVSPYLYLASDEIKLAAAEFEQFNPQFFTEDGYGHSQLDWLFDFYMMTIADVLVVSHSGFSIVASVINSNPCAVYLQPNMEAGNLVPFDPAHMDFTERYPGIAVTI